MKVWLCTIGQRLDNAENTRTMLLAKYLAKAGHEVTLWTSAYDHIRKEWRREWIGTQGESLTLSADLLVRFMKGCGYKRNIGPRRLLDHILAARHFRKQANALDPPDIVVASMPDHISAGAMVDYAKERNIPAIVDVRDKWPDIFVDYAPSALRPLVKIGLFYESMRARRALARSNSLVAMMQSMLDWGLSKAGRERDAMDRIFFLATMEKATKECTSDECLQPSHRRILKQTEGKLVFSFVGTFNRTQHPLLAIQAFEELSRTPDFPSDRIALLIGGSGLEEEEVESRVSRLSFGHYLGWLKPDEMRTFLTRSDVGLLPLNFSSPAFNNKAFAYLACGLPILNCAQGDLANLIEDRGIGLNIEAGNPKAMASAVQECIARPEFLSSMKRHVRTTFDELFDQDLIYRSYVNHIAEVARQHSMGVSEDNSPESDQLATAS